MIRHILDREKGRDGGLNPSPAAKHSDACINGMALNYAAYFGANEDQLSSIIDFLLGQQLGDGGFNCRLNRSGAQHSSVHTTLSVFEGISIAAAAISIGWLSFDSFKKLPSSSSYAIGSTAANVARSPSMTSSRASITRRGGTSTSCAASMRSPMPAFAMTHGWRTRWGSFSDVAAPTVVGWRLAPIKGLHICQRPGPASRAGG